jgi:hypothetical protein
MVLYRYIVAIVLTTLYFANTVDAVRLRATEDLQYAPAPWGVQILATPLINGARNPIPDFLITASVKSVGFCADFDCFVTEDITRYNLFVTHRSSSHGQYIRNPVINITFDNFM